MDANSSFTSKNYVLHMAKCKPPTIKSPQATTKLEQVHQDLITMLHNAQLDRAMSVVLDAPITKST